jgi:hypothetical protein
MNAFEINIIFFTYRSDFIAKANLKIALETIINHSNARLIVGYGGKDKLHQAWLENFKSQIDNKKSFELINEISLTKRMKWAVNFPSEWIIFISDDDPITSNYLSSYINEIKNADKSISNIFPKYYGLNNSSEIKLIKIDEITESNLIDRTQSYINGKNAGLRYYSAHRYGVINDIINEKFSLNFFPSYLDQLITLSSIIKGKSISCTEPSILTYNQDNWSTQESCIESDSKSYNNKEMVYFHEIFWISDYVNILIPYYKEKSHHAWIAKYCLKRLEDALQIFLIRLKLIPISISQSKFIIEATESLYTEIIACQNTYQIKIAIDNCKTQYVNRFFNFK